MKGIVFRSFEGFIADIHGEEVADAIMAQPALSTGGAYTTVGNYPHGEFIALAVSASEHTSTPLKQLVRSFGEALFHILGNAHSDMVAAHVTPIALLSVIETVIHRDVRKIYSNTELPRFDVLEREGDRYLHLEYSSARPFADLAEGLILGCLEHYGVKEISSIERYDLKPDGTHSTFKITVDQ